MNGPPRAIHHEPRWPPALAILAVLLLLRALPGHVFVIPVWVSYVAALAVLASMAAVAVTRGSALWLGIERAIIVFLALVYGANTLVELADMLGVITLHPSGRNAFSLLSSSVAIWVANVLAFSLLYWQMDRGGPGARARARARQAGLGLPPAGGSRGPAHRLAAAVPRLSVSRLQHGDSVQSRRCHAAHPPCQDADDARKHDLALDDGDRPFARDQCHSELTPGAGLDRRRGAPVG